MAALTSDRNTPARTGDLRAGPVAANARIFAGALIMRNATGYIAPGAIAAGACGIGRADIGADNRGGIAGEIMVDWRPGVFRFDNSSGSDLIGRADIGTLCYIVDDFTVAKTHAGNTRSPAGVVEDVDSIGVWVRMDEAIARALA